MIDVHIEEEKMKLSQIETNIAFQTAIIATSINKLMDKEYSDRRKQCKCKRFCRINHWKHNISKAYSSIVIVKFAEIKNTELENGEVEGSDNNSHADL